MAIRATGSPRAGNEERRFDTDGQLYTKAEFVGEYGGTREWEQAEPEVQKQEQPNAMLNTEDVSLISHTHGRERRAERSISRIELQAAVKHGRKEPAHPSAQGLLRWRYTYNGIVYVTDASSRHEITSWRDDGQDTPVQARGPGVYGAHVVLIVDASGSMRANDVKGYASRTAAVYECLARDLVQPQGSVGFQSHYGNAVVSLIEMSDQAEVLKKQVIATATATAPPLCPPHCAPLELRRRWITRLPTIFVTAHPTAPVRTGTTFQRWKQRCSCWRSRGRTRGSS